MTWPCAGSKEIWKNISPFFSKNEMNFEFFYHADGWLTLYNTQSLPTTDPPAVSKYDNPLHTTLSGKAPKSSILLEIVNST